MAESPPTLPKLFRGLDAPAAQRVARYLRREQVGEGQSILVEGERPGALYFVQRGLVRLVQVSAEGRVFVLGHRGPGDCLNLAPALEGRPLAATLEALGDTHLLILPAEHWRALLQEHPELYQNVALQLASELRALTDLVRELALHPVRVRLARFLLEQADGSAERWTQESIAASIGTVRDVVGRALRGLIEEGVLRKERGQLQIIDRPALERIARGD